MTTIPAPTILLPKEEWADADFDLPDDDPIHASDAESDKEDEDWDMDMNLGKTGGAKAQLVLKGMAARSGSSKNASQMFTIRPPLPQSQSTDEEDDDEGVSTIKVAALPKATSAKPPQSPIDEDFEDGFALPSDLTTLSLRPLSLAHRTSKSSLEWGDKDQTSSSQSSDAYSNFGFADNSPSSNYTSASLPETETEEDEEEEEDILEGLDVPTGLFESGSGAKKLGKILELKKKTAFADDRVKVVSPDPEDDFEIGLEIGNDTELSPSRLLQTAQSVVRSTASSRSKSAPPRPPAALRPPSRVKSDRAKSPNNPPISSMSQLRRITAPPASPPSSRTAQPFRAQTYSQAVASPSSMNFLAAKPGSLRVQKSTSGLKPPSPPATRKLGRKASLPSMSESNQPQASGSGSGSAALGGAPVARYETPTASSRAKVHTATTSRLHGLEYQVPPTRPSTPSSNPAALRLTMPTSSSRMKSRTPISNLFPQAGPASAPLARSTSPLPPARPPSRPPSATSSATSLRLKHSPSASLPSAPKVLKKPKRTRTYGDGTELDLFEDLPTDREKEGKYHVQPKGYGNRIPGASYPKPADASATGTIRRKATRNFSGSGSGEWRIVLLLHRHGWLTTRLRLPFQSRQKRQPRPRRSNARPGSSSRQSQQNRQNRNRPRMRKQRGGKSRLRRIQGENRLSSATWVALARRKV